MKMKIISGTFADGCGVIVYNKETNQMYHKVVYKGYIEIDGKIYRKEDMQ